MLKFVYGVMGSSKTTQALITAHSLKATHTKEVVLLRPSLDTRSAPKKIESRIGISSPCLTFSPFDSIQEILFTQAPTISRDGITQDLILIVDEAQFCSPEQVDELREIAMTADVFCYGLRTNFKTELFPGSKRLFEVADALEETQSFCSNCGRKATINALFIEGEMQERDSTVNTLFIGDTEYRPLCWKCYKGYTHA